MIWNGHELVSTRHPEDDDPWCKNCGLSADDPEARIPCREDPTMTHVTDSDNMPDEMRYAESDPTIPTDMEAAGIKLESNSTVPGWADAARADEEANAQYLIDNPDLGRPLSRQEYPDPDDEADARADEGHRRLQARFTAERANVMDVSEVTAIDNGTELVAIAQAKDVVRETYDMILAALAARRAERDAIEDMIAELVLAEALWKPLVYRLDHGPARRKRAEDADG